MRTRTINLVIFLSGLFFATLISEVVLRVAGVSYPTFTKIDPEVGASLRPEAEGWWRREGETYIRINSAGFRDREHPVEKPAGHFRIAVLGDSYAEALQVPLENTFWAIMERELSACRTPGFWIPEVLNFGVSGYGTDQELLTLQRKVWRYSPDLVILAMTTGNDIRNNSPVLEGNPKKPYFLLTDGRLEQTFPYRDSIGFHLRQSLPASWFYHLWSSSRITQLLSEAILRAQAKWKSDTTRGQAAATWAGFDEAGLDSAVYKLPEDMTWREAWAVTEALIRSIRDETRAHQVPLVVATLSNSPQVHPDPDVRRAFALWLGVSDLFYPDERIKAFSEQEGVAMMTLAPRLQAYAEQHRVFLHGFPNSGLGRGHWNEVGHRVAGQLLAERVCEEVLDDGASPKLADEASPDA